MAAAAAAIARATNSSPASSANQGQAPCSSTCSQPRKRTPRPIRGDFASTSHCWPKSLEIIPGATHLFEEPGALEQAAQMASDWFNQHLYGDQPNGNS